MIKNYSKMSGLFSSGHRVARTGPPSPGSKRSVIRGLLALVILLSSVTGSVFAQSTANYTFSTNATGSLALDQNGNAIDMSAGTTQLVAASSDQGVSPVTNLGFEFYFMGNSFTQFSVSANGLLQLGSTAVSGSTYVASGGTATAPKFSAFAGDLQTGSAGKVHYKVVGSAPNRCLVVEYLNMNLYYVSGVFANDATFQVRLYETSGSVEYVYGSVNVSNITSGSDVSPSIGFSSGSAANLFSYVLYGTHTASTSGTFTDNPTSVVGTVASLNSTANGSRRTYLFIPPGSPGNTVATTLAPPTALTFTGVSSVGMTLNWAASSPSTGVLKYLVFSSLDGVNYTYVNAVNVGTNTLAITGLSPSTNYTFKVFAISEGSKSTDLIGSQTTGIVGSVNAVASGNWSDTATWSTGAIPTAGDNVTIPAGFTVTEDVTAAVAYSLTVAGNLVYTPTTARTLTVTTDVTINAGGSFNSAASGTVTTHSLVVGGSLVNNGTLDFSAFTTSGATITFVGANSSNFTLGTGSVTNLRTVTVNKGTSTANVLTFSPGGTLTVQGANTAGFLTTTNGLFKLDGTNTFSNPLFATASYTIASTAGVWLNNPNATVVALAGSPTFSGLFRISSGTFNAGTATGNSVGFSAGSTTIIEGGVVNAASRFGVGTAGNTITYNQSNGVINVNQIGNASTTLASFDLGTSTTSTISITGGTVNVILANTGGSGPRDVRGTSVGQPVITGGVINFGTAASGASKSYFFTGNIPSFVVSNTSATHSASLNATASSFGNITVSAGSTFNLNGYRFIARGTAFTNDGILTGTATGSDLYFFGLAQQTYTGAGVVTSPLASLSVDANNFGLTVDNASSGINTLRVNLFGGTITNSGKITIGTGAALAATVQIGSAGSTTPGGNFDVSPTWNLGTGAFNIIYALESVSRTTGFEVPPTRTATGVNVSNTNGVILAGGNLEVSGTLTLTSGIVTTSAANVLSLGTTTTAGTLTGGSATSYVRGPFARTIASGNANTSYVLFPVGKVAYAPISLAPSTTAVSVFKAEAFDTNTGTEDPSIVGLNATRRWEAPLVSGTITDLNVRLAEATIVTGNIPVSAATASGVYASSFGSSATFTAGTPNVIQSTTAVPAANYFGFIGIANSNACVGTPAPGNTIASSTSICLGSSVTLSLQNATPGTGVTYVWESSTDGTTFTPIASATSATYTATPTVATYYRAQVTCSGVTTVSTPVQVVFTNNILTTTPASICGLGTAILQATATAGSDIKWYAQATGGTAVGTGASFTTPTISATTSYWAEASTTGATVAVGPASPTAQGGVIGDQTIAWDVSFTVLQATTLTSVDVFPLTSGQTAAIAVRNSAGTVIATYPYTTNVSGGLTAQTVVLNHLLAPGSYQLYPTLPSSGLKRNVSGAVYPYTSSVANITANGFDPTYFMGFYNWKFASSCNSPRVEVVATVTPAPALTLSGNPAAFCSGQSSSVVTLTSTASNYDNYVWSPATGVTGTAATGWTFNPTVSTAYTLTATQSTGSMCTAVATINVSVNQLPTPITVSPSPAIACENAILPLVVSGGTVGVVGKIGTGIATNTLSTPFKGNWGASKSQALYTAAELSALGLQAGQKVNSIGYVSLSGTPIAFNNFTITAGFVSASTLGTSFISGATTVVYGPATYTPASGTANLDFPVTASLVWDGVSNLLVETCFNNNNAGGAAATSLSIQSSTVASGLNLYRSQDNTADSCSNSTAPNGTTNRPNLRISTLESTNLSWSPVTNLYTDAAATVPYVAGTNAGTVYFKSSTAATAVTYTATATTTASCSISSTVDVTVNPVIAPDFAAIPAICSGSTAPTLATTSPNGVAGTWSPATVSNTANGTYVFTPTAGQCAATQTLTVTVTTTAAPTGTSPQDYTAGETLADFDVTGTGIIWYDAPSGGNVLPASTVLVSNVTYYASQTANGCESPTRLPVTAGADLKVDGFDSVSFKYYPNPVNNVLTVSYGQEITGLKLFNMVGQQLLTKKVNSTLTQLDMSHLPAGSYLLEVSSGDKSKVVKLLKNQ